MAEQGFMGIGSSPAPVRKQLETGQMGIGSKVHLRAEETLPNMQNENPEVVKLKGEGNLKNHETTLEVVKESKFDAMPYQDLKKTAIEKGYKGASFKKPELMEFLNSLT